MSAESSTYLTNVCVRDDYNDLTVTLTDWMMLADFQSDWNEDS